MRTFHQEDITPKVSDKALKENANMAQLTQAKKTGDRKTFKPFYKLFRQLFPLSVLLIASCSEPLSLEPLALSRPDFIIDLSGISSALPGEDIGTRLIEKVANIGTANSDLDYVQIDIVISTDTIVPSGYAIPSSTFREDALVLGGRDQAKNGLSAGSSYILPANDSEILPVDLYPGRFYLCATVDPGNLIAELNESNNTSCIPVDIGKSTGILKELGLKGEIVFSTRHSASDVDIHSVSASHHQLELDSPFIDWSPSWSPSKDRLSFTRVKNHLDPGGSLMSLDRSSKTITTLVSGKDVHTSSWARAGNKLAFDAYTGPLQSIKEDGSGQQVEVSSYVADRPSWSADGRYLYFHWIAPEDGWISKGIYVHDSWRPYLPPKRITSQGYAPELSPDGKQLAYHINVAPFNNDIMVLSSTCTLSYDNIGSSSCHTTSSNLTAPSAFVEQDPTWSPDGNYLAFSTNREGSFDIYVMRKDGHRPFKVFNAPSTDDETPEWR